MGFLINVSFAHPCMFTAVLMALGPKIELDVYIIDEGPRWESSAPSQTIS